MPNLHSIIKRVPSPIKQLAKDQLYPNLLAESSVAPEWQLQAHDGSWHRMKQKRWSLMIFYPGDDTPGCTKQLQDAQAHLEELNRLGCDVYAINPAEQASHAAFASKYGFEFPILTDRGGAVSRQFACTLSVPLKTWVIRTVYLINPKRTIRLANRGAPATAAIVRSIQALQQATKDGL